MPAYINNPYFILLLAVLVAGLSYVILRPEAIPAFLFLLLSGLDVFLIEATNIQQVPLLKAIILPGLMVVLLLRKIQSGEKMPLAGFVWVISYTAFVIFSCLINGADINKYRSAFSVLLLPLVVALCPNNEKTVKYLTIAFAVWGLANFLTILATLAGLGWARGLVTDVDLVTIRPHGLERHSTIMGMYFVICLNAVHVLFYQARTRFRHLLLFALGACLAVGLFATISVAALASWVCSFLFIQYRLRGIRLNTLIGVGACAVVVFGLIALPNLDALLGRMTSLLTDGSARARVPLLQMGMRLFLTSPLVGVSLGQGGRMHLEAHNTYMQVLMEDGIIGFLLFAGVLWKGLSGLRRRAGQDEPAAVSPEAAYYVGLVGTMLAIMINGLAHCNDYLMPLWLILGIGFMV
ncbi:MAG: O-antigen ligase family protein [Desulfobaccales bacterium]